MTRIESGTRKREVEQVDMVDVVRTSIETVTPAAQAKNVSIDLRSEDSMPMVADRSELEIIANNLLSNAVKYNREGGRVEVNLRWEGDKVVFRVSDTGIGMTSEEAARLFNDFVRIKNEKTRQVLGSGLGLSIVKKLAALYEGETDVKSEPDVGSTFTVRLNRETKGAADHVEASRDTELAAGK
jgi:signal transduction histidine kinase